MIDSRIKMARVMSGYSLQQLADKTDNAISKQSISKYEKGLMKPTIENLTIIAKALKLKLDYFLKESSIDLGEIKYRKQNRLPIKKQKAIIEKTRDFLERYIEAEDLLNVSEQQILIPKSIRVGGLEEMEVITSKLRNDWDIGSDPISNVFETLEQRGVKILYLDEVIPHFYGMSTWVNDNVPVIVLSKMPIDRIRFTALHELGHLLLDIEGLEDKAQERMCDRFAASMLLPKAALINELGGVRRNIHLRELALIKSEYGISPQAILYRAKDLKLISEQYFIQQVKFMRTRGLWRREIGSFKGEEKSNRLLQLLCRGIAEEFITSTKAASLYNMKLSEFRRVINQTNATSNN